MDLVTEKINTGQVSASFTGDKPGMYCTNHRSSYCPCAFQLILDRGDVKAVDGMIREGVETTSSNWSCVIAVPVAPMYCVWEKVTYKAVPDADLRGRHLVATNDMRKKWPAAPWMTTLQRIMPDDSILDLSNTITMVFEQTAQDWLRERVNKAFQLPGVPKCESPTHSYSYQKIVDMLFDKNSLKGLLEKNEDVSAQGACLYTMWTHKRCMFCYVNQNFRDALRVNPSMQKLVGSTDADLGSEDFSDMVPEPTTKPKSIWEKEPPF